MSFLEFNGELLRHSSSYIIFPDGKIPANSFAIVIPKVNATFASLGISTNNVRLIFKILPNQFLVYQPSEQINLIDSFEKDSQYYILTKAELDLSAVAYLNKT